MKLTILLNLKDKPDFTRRWFSRYNEASLPFPVIVADGGKEKAAEEMLRDHGHFPNIKYEYIHYPFDADAPAFFKKMHDALGRVKTPYVIMADNDDFYIPESLSQCADFLDKNPDHASVRRDIYDFTVIPMGDLAAESMAVYGRMTNVKPLYDNPSNDTGTALGRFEFFSHHSNSSWHDVHRTAVLKESFRVLSESGIRDFQIAEYLFNILNVSSGKVHRTKGLHMLHQAHHDSMGSAMARRNPFDWISSDRWSKDFLKMIDIGSQAVSSRDGISQEKAEEEVVKYYIANSLGKQTIGHYLSENARVSSGRKSWRNLIGRNNPLRKAVARIYIGWNNKRRERHLAENMRRSPYYPDIKSIEDFLAKK